MWEEVLERLKYQNGDAGIQFQFLLVEKLTKDILPINNSSNLIKKINVDWTSPGAIYLASTGS